MTDHNIVFMLLLVLLGVTFALDPQQHGNTRAWEQYTEADNSPDHRGLNNDARGQSLTSSVTVATDHEASRHTDRQTAESVEILHDQSFRGFNPYNHPVKMARFVADPGLAHLIEEVDKEEHQRLRDTTASTPEAIQRVTKAPAVETVTVHYQATKVPLLSYIWNEVINIGDLLGREVYDTLSTRISFLWRSFVKLLKSRRRRAITDASLER